MTPKEAAEQLERLPPVVVKERLLRLLEWQDRNGKILVHVSWYLRTMFYAEHPRNPLSQDPKVSALLKSIGKTSG